MKKWRTQENGITLIALVVTIIVLLILAGIAISLTIGNNGLFSRAGNAANTWRKAEANEAEEMKNFEDLYDNTVKDLGLEGEKQRETFTFTIAGVELTAYEGDTWYTWLKNVEEGLLSDKGLLDGGLLEGFIDNAEAGLLDVKCFLPGMASGASIEYDLPSGGIGNVRYSDKIDSNINYSLYAS